MDTTLSDFSARRSSYPPTGPVIANFIYSFYFLSFTQTFNGVRHCMKFGFASRNCDSESNDGPNSIKTLFAFTHLELFTVKKSERKCDTTQKDTHLINLSHHVIKMGTLFVSMPGGRGNSGDGGARGGVPRRRPIVSTIFLRFLILAPILMPR